MRSLRVQIRSEHIDSVLSLADEHKAESACAVPTERRGRDPGRPAADRSLVFLTIPNVRVGAFIDAVQRVDEEARFVLTPIGTLPLSPPFDRLDEQVRDVSRLSTLELVVGSLQSVGAWRGMLLFSVLAGAIGAYGLIFDVSYLLVAAMLVNPMGAPAQVAVIGLTIGDARMFGRGGGRFLVSLAVQALTAMALGFAYGLTFSTSMMEQVTALSTWAVLVAVAAGAAGAQAQVSSDRDSLVSGTAVGFMVTAAMAPPAAVLGLAIPIQRWDYMGLMAFLLALQFVAIAVGGGLVLYALGVRPQRESVGRGMATHRNLLAITVALTTIGLVFWQTGREPRFQKADLSRTALIIARDAVEGVPEVSLLESSARFTRTDMDRYEREGLIFDIIVLREVGEPSDSVLEARIRQRVDALVETRMEGVVPFVRLSLLPGDD